ncbi:S8 family serine peptidase [Mycoplasma sp. 31_09]|uniref:S8 family serine peptidase n=1 Tax=unclassified Mycoplasma TaxID=2683645 RepID=UPI003AB01F4A
MNKLILISVGTIVSTIPTAFSVSGNVEGKTIEEREKLNDKSNIELNTEAVDLLRSMYEPYYKKLGIMPSDRIFSKKGIDVDSPYNRVGILEIYNSNSTYIHSSKEGFKINYYKEMAKDEKEENMHGYAVSSIIGTDVGINPDANIFYASTSTKEENDYKNYINTVLNWYKKNNVNIVNLSLGPVLKNIDYNLDTVIENISGATHKNIVNFNNGTTDNWSLESIAPSEYGNAINLLHNPTKFQELIAKYKIIIMLNNFIKAVNTIKDKRILFEEINKFTKENDIIFVMSSSNINAISNDDLPAYKRSLYKYVLDFINHYEDIKKEITIIQSYFHDKRYMSLLKNKIRNLNDKKVGSSRNYIEELEEIINQITFIYNHNEEISQMYDKYQTLGKRVNDKFGADFDNLYYSDVSDNIIYVGAVKYNNKPTEFSYFINDNANMPIISAYGNYDFEDNELLSEKLGNESNRKTKAEKILSNSTLDKNFKEHIDKLKEFAGTSMSAPMISGLLSLIQTKFQKKLSLTEAKLLLSSSSNYSSTTIEKIYTSDFDYDVNKEFWKENHSKNKTGFGIPKYFIIKKLLFDSKVKSYSQDNKKISSLLGSGYNNFSILHDTDLTSFGNSERLEYTVAFNNIDWYTLLNNYFMKWTQNDNEKEIVKTLSLYIENKAKAESKYFIQSLNNIIDVTSELNLISNENNNISRYKSSASKNGFIERVYFGKFENKKYKSFKSNIYFAQFDALSRALEEAISKNVFNKNGSTSINKDYDSEQIKSVINRLYKKFIDDILDLKYTLKVNE